jgi:hypothetical protein
MTQPSQPRIKITDSNWQSIKNEAEALASKGEDPEKIIADLRTKYEGLGPSCKEQILALAASETPLSISPRPPPGVNLTPPVPPPRLRFPYSARELTDFNGVDRSEVYPRGEAKTIDHVYRVFPGTFAFYMRHRGDPSKTKGAWYDGDRDLQWNYKGHDKSRAEVNIVPNIKQGETWEFGSTVFIPKDFVPSRGYCNLMQPIFSVSFLTLYGIRGNSAVGSLFFNADPDAIGSKTREVRDISIPLGKWTRIRVRIKVDKKGSMGMSVGNDDFESIEGIDTSRARKLSSKWGLYGTGVYDYRGKPLKDTLIWQSEMYAVKKS